MRLPYKPLKTENSGYDSSTMIAGIIGILVVVVVGLALLTPIQDSVDNSTVTGSALTLVELIPLLVVVGLLLSIVFWAVARYKGR